MKLHIIENSGPDILADLRRLELQTVTYDCEVAARLAALYLHWVTFEDVISNIPDGNGFNSCLVQLVSRAGESAEVRRRT